MENTFEKEKIIVAEILKLNVSFFDKKWSPPSETFAIEEVLSEIKSETHSKQVNFLRELLRNGEKEKYDIHKGLLPAVTFCGVFQEKRNKASLKTYNRLIVLDIDKLSPDEFQRTKECLSKDEFVLAFWESPSQQGVKGLVHLSYSVELSPDNTDKAHKGAFKRLEKYFYDNHKIPLDDSGSDTPRLCFLSYDPSIVIKKEATSFEISETDILAVPETKEKTERVKQIHKSSKDALFNPKDRNSSRDRKTIQAIIKFLTTKNKSITNSYESWYRVSLAIANAFTYEIGEKYFLKLSSLDKGKFNEANCKNMLLNSYEIQTGKINFSTIVYLANEQGYKTKHQKEESSEVANESLSQVSSS